MKKIKVSEATGTTLDWLVAKCEGHKSVFTSHWVTPVSEDTPRRVCVLMPSWVQPYEPSRNWAQGGPSLRRGLDRMAMTCDETTCWAITAALTPCEHGPAGKPAPHSNPQHPKPRKASHERSNYQGGTDD